MLTIYQRHRKACPRRGDPAVRVHVEADLWHRKAPGKVKGCGCSLWVDGLPNDRKESLHTGDWQKATEQVRDMAANGGKPPAPAPAAMTLAEAWDKFIADTKSCHLSDATIYKYTLLKKCMVEFAEGRGFQFLSQFDLDALTAFRSTWKLAGLASGKRLGLLRTFYGFAVARKWVEENPAKLLKYPKVKDNPTKPFTKAEMAKILFACDVYAQQTANNGKDNARRLLALVLLLRYSGLRIGDGVSLTADRITGNKLFLYMAKTEEPVNCVLPPEVVEALEGLPKTAGHFFWNGESKLSTAVKMWCERFHRLFKLAGIQGGHAHRFRDTFAVELLLKGVPLDRVQILLGHRSIKITERHYSPWVAARQEQIEADLESSWAGDDVLASLGKGTPQVHSQHGRPN